MQASLIAMINISASGSLSSSHRFPFLQRPNKCKASGGFPTHHTVSWQQHSHYRCIWLFEAYNLLRFLCFRVWSAPEPLQSYFWLFQAPRWEDIRPSWCECFPVVVFLFGGQTWDVQSWLCMICYSCCKQTWRDKIQCVCRYIYLTHYKIK